MRCTVPVKNPHSDTFISPPQAMETQRELLSRSHRLLPTMSVCADCFKGVRHEGEPEGATKTIGGIECYVATPTGDYSKDKAILFVTDGFGLFLNNKLLADDLARNGFYTVVPDLFSGSPAPADAFTRGPDQPAFDFNAWLGQHDREVTRPILDSVIPALKNEGIARFAAAGYCFGGRYVFDLAFENILHVSAVSHPSMLVIPDDLTKYATSSNAPLLINNCTTDPVFPVSAGEQADAILGGGAFKPDTSACSGKGARMDLRFVGI
ncbi:Dienelactone hydrolase endo-1,3,1,4-beta-D-glucanase [Mycena kentingensis (nom. inval.)]|nr:Dienelactone hydrolase endo-1,3,1,4-beta-D-glucanase [Mycena kentingensis (nom. inval.)]